MDTLNNKEMMALTRLSLSYDRWASALKSGAGAKQWLVENDRAEKIAGGAKKLAEADKILADANKSLADAKTKAARIVDDASVFADNIKTEAAVNSNKHTAALNERERTLEAQCAAADKLALGLDEQAVALDGREKRVTEAETANGNNEARLDAVQVRLANWEQTLNARDTRVKAAVNG